MSDPSDGQPVLRQLIQSPQNRCFVCGPENPLGLQVQFHMRDGRACAIFEPGDWHQGWQGVVHGGVLTALLDEAMAYTLFFRGLQGVTARMDLRFRLPAHAHDQLEVEAWTVKENRRITDIEARISRDGIVLVESTARFMKLGEIRPETLTGEAPLEERVR